MCIRLRSIENIEFKGQENSRRSSYAAYGSILRPRGNVAEQFDKESDRGKERQTEAWIGRNVRDKYTVRKFGNIRMEK